MSRSRWLWNTAILATVLTVLPASASLAQSALDACQDQLRGMRVYAERLGKSKQADDLDAAQAIAALIKQVEVLRAEVEQAKQQLQEKSKAAEKPKE